MQRFFTSACLSAGLLLIVLLCGCGGGGEELRQFGSLQFNLTTPKTTYSRGEQVPLTFTVKNVGTQTVNTIGGGCTVLFKVVQGNQTMGPEPLGCGTGGFTYSFAPGEMKSFTINWDQAGTQGSLVAPGQYTLKVWYKGVNVDGVTVPDAQVENTLSANPIQITIQ